MVSIGNKRFDLSTLILQHLSHLTHEMAPTPPLSALWEPNNTFPTTFGSNGHLQKSAYLIATLTNPYPLLILTKVRDQENIYAITYVWYVCIGLKFVLPCKMVVWGFEDRELGILELKKMMLQTLFSWRISWHSSQGSTLEEFLDFCASFSN
jgi:hypothetical protein